MNTRPAFVALALTVSLATLAHADVPDVRVGETPEQITGRQWRLFVEEPVPVFPYVNATRRGWRLYPGFYRGRADTVTYEKDQAISQAEIDELLKLNGGGRRWRKSDERGTKGENIDSSRATGWMTEDGLLRASFAGGAALTIFTAGYPDRAADPVKVNREDARRAFELGASLGILAPLFLRADPNAVKNRATVVKRTFGEIHAAEAARAADPSIGVRDLPAKKGVPALDLVGILSYQTSVSDTVLSALGKDEVTAGQPAVAGCFNLGLNGALLVFFHQNEDPRWTATYLEKLAAAGGDSNLSKHLWEPLVEKVRAGAPAKDVSAAFLRMHNDALKFLDAKPPPQ